MVSNTRDKLNEAKYFLNCMEINEEEQEKFKFNLSAFISAFRSVTLFMQKEFDKIDGFKEWYKQFQKEIEKDEIFKLINTKRVMTIHHQSLDAYPQINYTTSVDFALIIDSVEIEVTHEDGKIERMHTNSKGEWETINDSSKEASSNNNTKKININKSDKDIKAGQMEWKWYFKDSPEKDILTFAKEALKKLEKNVNKCEELFKNKKVEKHT